LLVTEKNEIKNKKNLPTMAQETPYKGVSWVPFSVPGHTALYALLLLVVVDRIVFSNRKNEKN
jgi:hypothetical protein